MVSINVEIIANIIIWIKILSIILLRNINITAPILNQISVNVVVISSATANKIATISHINFIVLPPH